MRSTTNRRRCTLLATMLAAMLPMSLLGVAHAQTTTEDPAEAAAGWLATHVNADLELVTGFGTSTGVTIDAVLAFDTAGVAGDLSADVAGNVAADATAYASFPDEDPTDPDAQVTTWIPGSLGKLLLLANARPELDPTSLGGVDAVAELQGIECTEARPDCDDDQAGLFKGLGAEAGETLSTLNQAVAVLGLVASGNEPSPAAIAFLADQACDDGGFGFPLRTDEDCSSDADTTGLVAQALIATGDDAAAQGAITWLLDNQDASGGFVGFAGVDASTTAYPVMALLAAGEHDAATAGIEAIAGLQAGCDAPEEMIGAIYFNEPDEDGETAADDVFATAQATPALAGQHLLEISGAGSSNALPTLACPADQPADDTATDDADVDDVVDGDAADGDAADAAADEGDVLPETGTGLLPIAMATVLLLSVGIGLLRLRRSPASDA